MKSVGVAVKAGLTADDIEAQRAVGALIRTHRERLGYSQTYYGSLVGWSQRYVSKVERGGVAMPRDATLRRIGKPLGLELADFYAARGLLPARAPARLRHGYRPYPDEDMEDEEAIEYCIKHRDRDMRERALRAQERLPRPVFVGMCRRVYRAHYANSDNIFGQVEQMLGEVWDEQSDENSDEHSDEFEIAN